MFEATSRDVEKAKMSMERGGGGGGGYGRGGGGGGEYRSKLRVICRHWLLEAGVWKSFWCLGTYNLCLEICVNRNISSKCDIARISPNLTKILQSA